MYEDKQVENNLLKDIKIAAKMNFAQLTTLSLSKYLLTQATIKFILWNRFPISSFPPFRIWLQVYPQEFRQ